MGLRQERSEQEQEQEHEESKKIGSKETSVPFPFPPFLMHALTFSSSFSSPPFCSARTFPSTKREGALKTVKESKGEESR